MNLQNATGMLICYRTWDELDKYYESLNKLKIKIPCDELVILKAFNSIDGIPYPFTLALIVENQQSLNALDDYLCDNSVDLGNDKDMYVGNIRIQEFFSMIPIGKYPPGMLKIQYGRCEVKGVSVMACMFCQYGHMLSLCPPGRRGSGYPGIYSGEEAYPAFPIP